jgi:hypothetical protein
LGQREHQQRRQIAVHHFDDQIGTIERREPAAVALRPMIAASHARPGDADDRAKHQVREGYGQSQK